MKSQTVPNIQFDYSNHNVLDSSLLEQLANNIKGESNAKQD